MGSVNCKEYVTTNDAITSQPENGKFGKTKKYMRKTSNARFT